MLVNERTNLANSGICSNAAILIVPRARRARFTVHVEFDTVFAALAEVVGLVGRPRLEDKVAGAIAPFVFALKPEKRDVC